MTNPNMPTLSSGAMREKLHAPVRYDLVPIEAIDAYARVSHYGATKYAPWNWSKGLPRLQICASLIRHLFAYMRGEDYDPESGLLHTDHIIWNAGALCHHHHWAIEDNRTGEPERDYKIVNPQKAPPPWHKNKSGEYDTVGNYLTSDPEPEDYYSRLEAAHGTVID